MGKLETRKAKTARIYPIDIVILFVIIFIWYVTLQFLFSFNVAQAPCVEALYHIGTAQISPRFVLGLKVLSIAVFAAWAAINIWRYHNRPERPASWGLQAFMGLALILLMLAHHMMTPRQAMDAPDGVMRLHYSFALQDNDKHMNRKVFTRLLGESDVFGSWQQGKDMTAPQKRADYRPYGCVWIDKNLISVPDVTIDNELAPMSHMERFLYYRKHGKKIYQILPPRGFSAARLRDSLYRPLDTIKETQYYRPMSAAERARFKAQQACQADIENHIKPRDYCEFHWTGGQAVYDNIPQKLRDAAILDRLTHHSPAFE